MERFLNRIIPGNNVDILKEFSDNIIDLIVTSPPYDNIRNYKNSLKRDNNYCFDFKNVVKELFRVCQEGGVVVWVVGDAVLNGSETGTSFRQALYFIECGFNLHDTMIFEKNSASFPARRDSNRYTQIFEYMFVFSKGKPKTANLICDKKNKWAGFTSYGNCNYRQKDDKIIEGKKIKPVPEFSPRNNIWKYNTGKNMSSRDKEAFEHPAIFPEKLAEDHILTWSQENDIVLDPFCGSGTTLKMAKLNNRNYIGIDIVPEYVKISEKRLKNEG